MTQLGLYIYIVKKESTCVYVEYHFKLGLKRIVLFAI